MYESFIFILMDYHNNFLPNHPSCHLELGKIIWWTDKKLYNTIEIVYVTCPNILKMDAWTGAMKSLGRTLHKMAPNCDLKNVDCFVI